MIFSDLKIIKKVIISRSQKFDDSFILLICSILIADMMICLDINEFYFSYCGGGLFVWVGDKFSKWYFGFYVLVVHGTPTDSLPSGQEYFHFEFSL